MRCEQVDCGSCLALSTPKPDAAAHALRLAVQQHTSRRSCLLRTTVQPPPAGSEPGGQVGGKAMQAPPER